MSISEKLVTIAENEQKVYDAGKCAEHDWFWDTMQQNGKRTDYLYAFAGDIWDDTLYQPKYTITPTVNSQLMYAYSRITDTKVDINMVTTGVVGNIASTFSNASKLKTIRKLIIDERIAMNTHFNNCKALENITIEGTIGRTADFQWCPLSRTSVENVMSVLSDTTTGLTVTFNQAAVEATFDNEEWASLIATKPNWTISLV